MTERKKRIICGIIVLILAAAWLFYAFPRTPEQMVKRVSFDECTRIILSATENPTDAARDEVNYSLALEKGDAGFDELISAVRRQSFSRKALGALSKNATKSHPISAGDYRWSAIFVCGDSVFRLDDFFGDLSMSADPGDMFAKLRTANSGAFTAELFEMIKQNSKTTTENYF